ncbi:MAG: AMP-binding protein [Fibrobacteres bacterium]|nr:AMP-binding protein [Fibrobacterota bacterium]
MAPNLARHFYSAAARAPRYPAVLHEGGSLDYAGLRDLAESLRGGLADDQRPFAAVLSPRTPFAYAAVQAILAEGKAYVPLNPKFPAERNAYILEKAEISTLLVGWECLENVAALAPLLRRPLRVLLLDTPAAPAQPAVAGLDGLEILRVPMRADREPAPLKAAESGGGYVLFTSGSTGKPKGVRVTGANVESYLRSFQAAYPLFPGDRVSQLFDLTFDLAAHDQFSTWAAGATLVAFPEKALLAPIPFARNHGVTVWFSVPALPAFLESARQAADGALPEVRLSLFAGEKLTLNTCALWRRIAPNSRIANLYGPTEATIAITHFELLPGFPPERALHGGVPIGKTFPGQEAEVLREDGSLCGSGEIGSLWLAGDQVAEGYVGDEAKTAERFQARGGKIWYRTGDLVARDDEGYLHYLGREDFQVKVMGYRIELGEIEHALLAASGAAIALADVAPLRNGLEEIYGVLPAACAPRRKAILAGLKERLPAYMVPRRVFFRDDIPVNSNGKMDRQALKAVLLAEAAAAADTIPAPA